MCKNNKGLSAQPKVSACLQSPPNLQFDRSKEI